MGRAVPLELVVLLAQVGKKIRTAVPFWGQTNQILRNVSPKRDCGSKGVNIKGGASKKRQTRTKKQSINQSINITETSTTPPPPQKNKKQKTRRTLCRAPCALPGRRPPRCGTGGTAGTGSPAGTGWQKNRRTCSCTSPPTAKKKERKKDGKHPTEAMVGQHTDGETRRAGRGGGLCHAWQ